MSCASERASEVLRLVENGERVGTVVGRSTASTASICRAHGAVLATRDTKDFAHTGVALIDPWVPA